MVNRVVPREQLQSAGLDLAEADRKEAGICGAIGQAGDQSGPGPDGALACDAPQLCIASPGLHAHNELKFGVPTDPRGTSARVGEKMLDANRAHVQRAAGR